MKPKTGASVSARFQILTRTTKLSKHRYLTFAAEPPLLVVVIVGSGRTPLLTIGPSVCGALLITLFHEDEWEHARFFVNRHYDTEMQKLLL